MSKISVKVDFMAGTTIKEAISEAKDKAILWDVAYINFNFNGTSVSVGKNCNVLKSAEQWSDGIENGGTRFVFNWQ